MFSTSCQADVVGLTNVEQVQEYFVSEYQQNYALLEMQFDQPLLYADSK